LNLIKLRTHSNSDGENEVDAALLSGEPKYRNNNVESLRTMISGECLIRHGQLLL
jgi:hypothetical protein